MHDASMVWDERRCTCHFGAENTNSKVRMDVTKTEEEEEEEEEEQQQQQQQQ